MIRNHEFNSHWWGTPIGFIDDPAFFTLTSEKQQDILAPYAWAEFCSDLDQTPPLENLAAAGFNQFDTQIHFLINLSKVEASASTERLDLNFADQINFDIDAKGLALFTHERFHHIPGCTVTRTNERYAMWANKLINEHPKTCMQLFLDNRLQGWFLSLPGKKKGLDLALAMLSNTAEISGMLLYQQACIAYALRGHRLGSASFSVTNTAVHNIYTTLGARFMSPSGNWLWLSQAAGISSNE